jgi:hypothetical protein
MTVAVVVEGVLLVAALLFVVALLRSYAEILRRVASLEETLGTSQRVAPGSEAHAGGGVSEIVGVTPRGDAVKLSLRSGSSRTLLAFLSTGCSACEALWSELHDSPGLPRDVRLVVITKGPDLERPARLDAHALRIDLIMSTQAWEDFAVPATPHFVLVGASDGILGRGSAASWKQILNLVADADEDIGFHRARTTEQRAQRAEQALAAAGIGPGHPSLYPAGSADDQERHG